MQNTNTGGSDIAAQIDDTTAALSGGLTSIPLDMAASVVGNWQQILEASGNPDLESIASDLGELRAQLTGGDLDGATVGALLTSLGSQVSSVASAQSGLVSSSLTQLGSVLASAGASLGT